MRVRLVVAALSLSVLCAGRSWAQQAAVEQIAGKVVSARDGRPIPEATVRLLSSKTHTVVGTVHAGEDGGFHFDPVPTGNYQMIGNAPGYLAASYLQHDNYYSGVVTGAGLDTGSLTLELAPASSISGRVVDESGEPVRQGLVRLYRKQPDADQPVGEGRMSNVDEEGAFDFEELPPGEYFVAVTSEPWYAVHPMPQPTGANFATYRNAVDPALDVVYPMTFYPNATSPDAASPVEIKGGEQVTLDMQLVPRARPDDHGAACAWRTVRSGDSSRCVARCLERRNRFRVRRR